LARVVLAAIVSLLLLVGITAQASERPLDPDNTVILQLDDGPIVIELNPVFAPVTSAQFKRLVREGFYDGLGFYRVIDGFVAQGGDGSDMSEEENAEPGIEAEFERDWDQELRFVPVQSPDLFAPETGFIDGFPAARDAESGKVWLAHCPGTVGMARGNEPDSGSTDFYIVIGQAPRYLERNITAFGRVVYGMDVVQRIKRGPPEQGGMIAAKTDATVIQSARLLADVTAEERLSIAVPDTNSDEFRAMFEARRNRTADWFVSAPPAVLDVCQIPNHGRLLL
jgi:peptidylprolyl isomerase